MTRFSRRRLGAPWWLALVLSAPACADSARDSSRPGADPAWVAEETPAGPTIALVHDARPGSVLRFDVRAKDVPALQAVAFRLSYDPAALKFAGASASSVWPAGSIAEAKEVEPGSLWVVWSATGSSGGVDGRDQSLGTLEFDHEPDRSTDVTFGRERSAAFGERGAPHPGVRFAGGRLEDR